MKVRDWGTRAGEKEREKERMYGDEALVMTFGCEKGKGKENSVYVVKVLK